METNIVKFNWNRVCGQRLKATAKSKNMSNKDMAALLSYNSGQEISMLYTGKTHFIESDRLDKLASYFGLRHEYILALDKYKTEEEQEFALKDCLRTDDLAYSIKVKECTEFLKHFGLSFEAHLIWCCDPVAFLCRYESYKAYVDEKEKKYHESVITAFKRGLIPDDSDITDFINSSYSDNNTYLINEIGRRLDILLTVYGYRSLVYSNDDRIIKIRMTGNPPKSNVPVKKEIILELLYTYIDTDDLPQGFDLDDNSSFKSYVDDIDDLDIDKEFYNYLSTDEFALEYEVKYLDEYRGMCSSSDVVRLADLIRKFAKIEIENRFLFDSLLNISQNRKDVFLACDKRKSFIFNERMRELKKTKHKHGK